MPEPPATSPHGAKPRPRPSPRRGAYPRRSLYRDLQQRIAAPSVKLQLAAIRMLFDWLVLGQIVPTNPPAWFAGRNMSSRKEKPQFSQRTKPAPSSTQSRSTHTLAPRLVGLRDRALIALLTYTFSRRRGRHYARRGRLHRSPAGSVGALARKRRQAPRDALPP